MVDRHGLLDIKNCFSVLLQRVQTFLSVTLDFLDGGGIEISTTECCFAMATELELNHSGYNQYVNQHASACRYIMYTQMYTTNQEHNYIYKRS